MALWILLFKIVNTNIVFSLIFAKNKAMKKIFGLIVLSLLIAGCSTSSHYLGQRTVTFLDYRPYTTEGFFFSSDPYPEAYSPIGQLLIEIIPPKTLKGVEMPSPDDLLEAAYKEAVDRGANGIANFSMKIDDTYTSVSNTSVQSGKYKDGVYPSKSTTWVPAKRITLSGTLIKIK